MIVLHIITRLNKGGTATWLKELFLIKNPNFSQILFFGSTSKNEEEDFFYKNIEFKKFNYLKRNFSPIKDLISLIQIRSEIMRIRPEVVNTHTFKAGVIGRIACLTVNYPVRIIHTYHGHLIYGYFGIIKKFLFVAIEYALAKITDHFISNGNQTKVDLLKYRIGKSNQYDVVMPCTNLKPARNNNSSLRRTLLNISSQSFVVGWLGRLAPIKNPNLLIEIAHRLPNIQFLVGGSGELANDIKKISPKNIRYLGWCEPGYFWSLCNVAILTSRNEAVPFSLVEAAACGKPIIASEIGSISDVVTLSNGFIVNNIGDYVTAIITLRNNKLIRRSMEKASAELAKNLFSNKKFLQNHSNIYRRFALTDS